MTHLPSDHGDSPKRTQLHDGAQAHHPRVYRNEPNARVAKRPTTTSLEIPSLFWPDFELAFSTQATATRLDPKYAEPYNSRAWLWATCPDEKYRDGKKAVESATRACELTDWKDADQLDTLAAAYAEAGDFAKAVDWQEKAIKLFSGGDKSDWVKRLELYRDKKPYRDTE